MDDDEDMFFSSEDKMDNISSIAEALLKNNEVLAARIHYLKAEWCADDVKIATSLEISAEGVFCFNNVITIEPTLEEISERLGIELYHPIPLN
jgi:hypothetical protein